MLALLVLSASLQAQGLDGVCARVRMEIPQELTLERIGFEATLEVTNNDGEDPLTEFSARLVFIDPSKDPTDPEYDASSLFFVQPPQLENVNSVEGSGVIGPTRTAIVRWFIIPKIAAGGEDPRGKPYLIGCELAANIRGAEVPADALLVVPEQISVAPDAQLDIVYFQPQYVTGDDPFTPEVESPVPFTLGVLVRNKGFGPANNLRIESQQPRITENLQGLLLVARLLGTRVMDEPLDENSLTVNLGNVPPGGARKGAWDMITSLSGIFTEFRASYRHAPELGGEETSVITSIAAHFIVGEVLNDEPGRDGILDFLADTTRDGMPDTLFESEGPELPVNIITNVREGALSGNVLSIDTTVTIEGWGYFRLDDPAQGRLNLSRVVRSDGKVLHPRNAWLEERYTPGRAQRDYFLHVFDRVEIGEYQYTVTYEPPPLDVTPPVTRMRFNGEVTHVGNAFFVTPETQMFFTAEDESPVSIVYQLNDGDLRPALPFVLREPGEYEIRYFATDAAGNAEEPNVATLIMGDAGPVLTAINTQSGALSLKGGAVSVRSGEVVVETMVAPNPLDVDAAVTVFSGTRAFPRLIGVPPSPTSATSASIAVVGEQVERYQFRVNGGEWSTERAADVPIELAELSGSIVLEVRARAAVGSYDNALPPLQVTWTVLGTAPAWHLTGAPSHPTQEQSVALTVARDGISLYRWQPDNSFFRAEAALAAPVVIDRLAPGERTLRFIGNPGGEWEETAAAATYRWTIDPAYGSDYSGLQTVYDRQYPQVQGSQFAFVWDGRSADGRLQAPGWYTVFITLTDSLGRQSFQSALVQISDLASDQQTLVSQALSPRNPHGRGAWLVWQQRSDGSAWQIYAHDQSEQGAAPMAVTVGQLSQENPRTDGRYVVWQGRRLDGSWDIRMMDLANPSVIVDVTETPERNEINPAISWPWVVYQVRPVNQPTAPWQLEAFNVVTGERHWVYPGQDDQLNPSVDAGRVVWRDLRDPGNGEIYFQNLETGETLRLTDDLFGQFFPVIHGNWIAWQDNRDGQVEIYGYHLLERQQRRLTSGPGDKTRPFLNGGWLVYEEDSFGLGQQNIQMLDLESGRAVPMTYDAQNKSRPVLVGGQLVWQAGQQEPFALRGTRLPALQAVFRSTNAVAVSQDMVARYGSAFALLADWHPATGVTGLARFTQYLPTPVSESVVWESGAATGIDFPLVPGEFLWVEFPDSAILDLGQSVHGAINLQAGLNAFSYDQFPLDYTLYRLIDDIGSNNVVAVRMLEAASGLWRAVEVTEGGDLLGPNAAIPSVAVVLLELKEPITGWRPQLR